MPGPEQVQAPAPSAEAQEVIAQHEAGQVELQQVGSTALKPVRMFDASGNLLTPREVADIQQNGPDEGPYKGGHR